MRLRSSYQARILGGCLLVVLCTLLAVGVLLQRSLGGRILSQAQDGLENQLALVKELVRGRWRPGQDIDATQALARELATGLNLRLTLIEPQGRVVGDSGVERPGLDHLENHAHRPEVRQALAEGLGASVRFSTTLDVNLLYVAGLVGEVSHPGLVVRLALPLADLDRTLSRVRRLVLGAVLLGALLSIGVAYLVAHNVSRPLKDLTDTVQVIAAGNLAARVRRYPRHEVGELGRAFDTMAESLQQKIEDITRARDRQEAILGAMVEGVMLVDPNGYILLANQALVRLLNLRRDPLGCTPLEMLRNPELQEAMRAVLGGEPHASREIRVLGPGTRHLEVQVARLSSNGPQTGGAVAVFHDITERKRVEKMRREFVANVSHELRTPLTAIKGSAETLLDGALDSPQYARHFVEMIERHTQRLQHLVEDLLDLASIESGEAAPQKEIFSAADLADVALSTVSELAAHKSVELVRELPSPPPNLNADRQQLEQAVLNLLDNAVKYSQDGGRVVFGVQQDGDKIIISVSDNGPGIAAEHLPRLFERFYRVDRDRSRQQGGTGLGLAIVKHVTQAHGGRVEVDSHPGRGSTFRLVLPA
ncbi:MAG: ATP-binding protein [Pseudomonadota bacterium]